MSTTDTVLVDGAPYRRDGTEWVHETSAHIRMSETALARLRAKGRVSEPPVNRMAAYDAPPKEIAIACPTGAVDDYYADYTHVSNSMIKTFLSCRQEYHARYVLRTVPEKPSTKEQLFGRAFHTVVLEPHKFGEQYDVGRKINRRTKAGKEEYAAQKLALAEAGKVALDPDDVELLGKMGAAMMANPVAKKWFYGQAAEVEKEIRWTCPRTGVARKAKLDWVSPELKLIVDLKTTDDAAPGAWAVTQTKYAYHRQVAAYLEAAAREYGPGDWTFLFFAVSKREFPQVGAYILPDQALALGERENTQALTDLKTCIDTGDWSDPWSQSVKPIDIKKWGYSDLNNEFGDDRHGN